MTEMSWAERMAYMRDLTIDERVAELQSRLDHVAPVLSPEDQLKEQQKSEVSAAIAEAYIHLNQQAHEDGQDWVQPTGVHDAYTKGITVKHDGKTWESMIFANVWAPGVSGWREVVSDGGVAAWVQPTGSHDAYNKGDRVSFNGSNYESLIDGNVWSPSDYPAAWKAIA